MKKKLKIIFIYIGVLLLSLLMTVVACAAFLFFYREGNIFGIQYIKRNEILYADVSGIAGRSVSGITVIVDDFDVNIGVSPYGEEVRGALNNKVFGYTLKSNAQASITAKYDSVSGEVIFTIVEPQGWLSKKDCYVAIAIPETLAQMNIDLTIKTDKGDILIGRGDQISFGDVNIESSKGEVTLSNVAVENVLNANIGSGWIYVDEKCVADNVDVNVKLGSGKINFTRIDNFNIKTFKIESIKSGVVGVLRAYEVVTDGNIQGGGTVEIGSVTELEILSQDTNIKVGTVGQLGSENLLMSRVDITGIGSVELDKVYSKIHVTGHNGYVKINNATGTVSVATNQGDIQISNAYKDVSVDTQYGNALVQFSSDESAPDYTQSGRAKALFATTKNGHIMAKGVQNANVTIRDKGRVSLDYEFVRGENVITSLGIGNINIVVPYENENDECIAFDLRTKSESKLDVEVGTVSSKQAELIGNTYYLDVDNVYGTASGNVLKIESVTGNIKLRSRNLIDF